MDGVKVQANRSAAESKDKSGDSSEGTNEGKGTERRKESRLWTWLLAVVLFVVSVSASYSLGFVLAWLTGASKSLLGATVAPLIFGILAALSVKSSLEAPLKERWMIYRAILVAVLICVFCFAVRKGLKWGIRSRSLPYDTVQALLGPAWDDCDMECATKVHAFRAKARAAGLSYQEYEPFMRDVVRPIIEDSSDDQLDRLSRAFAEMESALPKPEPNPNEPTGEPTGRKSSP